MANKLNSVSENSLTESTTFSKCKSKADPNFKLYVTGCLTKKCFKTKEAVIKFLEGNKLADGYKDLYAYKCSFCSGWHFTSRHPNKSLQKAGLHKSQRIIKKTHWKELPPLRPDSWGWKKTKAFLENLMKKDNV